MAETTVEKLMQGATEDPLFAKVVRERRLAEQLAHALYQIRMSQGRTLDDIVQSNGDVTLFDVREIERCTEAGEALKTLERYASWLGATVRVQFLDAKNGAVLTEVDCKE